MFFFGLSAYLTDISALVAMPNESKISMSEDIYI